MIDTLAAVYRIRVPSLLLAATSFCLLVSAGPARAGEYVDPTYDHTVVQEDILYGGNLDSDGERQELHLDLYRPATEGETAGEIVAVGNRPLLVFAHGGSFKSGNRKSQYQGYFQRMAKLGYAVASITYRLRPSGSAGYKPNHEIIVAAVLGDSETLRDAAYDMLAAVRFLRANATTYGIDPDRIAVGGSSAGAVAALQAAINTEDPGDTSSSDPAVNAASSDVAAAVSVSGAADPDHIELGDPPFLQFHGGADTTVPAALGLQSCAINQAMTNGCELHYWPNGGHTPWAEWIDVIVDTSSRFLCREMLADQADCGPTPPPIEHHE